MAKLKPLEGFVAQSVLGADQVQINPGDHVITTSVQGNLSWGIFLGTQEKKGASGYKGNTRTYRRMYYSSVDERGQVNGRGYINVNSIVRSYRIIKR
jgi:hypothetical protein